MAEIYLRPLAVEDADISHKWRNDVELWKYTGRRPDMVVTKEIEREWAARVIADTTRANYAICTNDSKYIGNIYLVNIHEGSGELGVFIGDRSRHGKGYGSQALEMLKLIAKDELGLSEILIDVDESNAPAMKTYIKCGAVRVEEPYRKLREGRIWMRIEL